MSKPYYVKFEISKDLVNAVYEAVRVAKQSGKVRKGDVWLRTSLIEEALVTDPKEPVWTRTPLSAPDKSLEKRTAKLKLSEDGTLEGDVQIVYTGHAGAAKKE